MEYRNFEKTKILNLFPQLELCYEKKSHNKVFKDVCLAIPKGQKCFAWFTFYREEPICFFLFKDYKSNKIITIKSHLVCFNELLCAGTVVYGTFINHKQNKFFYVEDILMYQNKSITNNSFSQKLNYLHEFFSHIKQTTYGEQFVVFGMVPMHSKYSELRKMVQEFYVETHHIQHRSLHKPDQFIITSSFKKSTEERNFIRTFKVKAESQNDIYSLYIFNKGKEEYYDTAYVSNFDNSSYLNSLFRKIKENNNLDALEESDSEEEFECISDDKFMLHKTFIMDCKYNSKFKKWEPFRISKRTKIVSLEELKNI